MDEISTYESVINELKSYGCEYQVKKPSSYIFRNENDQSTIKRMAYFEDVEIKSKKKLNPVSIGIVAYQITNDFYEVAFTFKSHFNPKSGVIRCDDTLSVAKLKEALVKLDYKKYTRMTSSIKGTYSFEIPREHKDIIPNIIKYVYINVIQEPIKMAYDKFGSRVTENDVKDELDFSFPELDEI